MLQLENVDVFYGQAQALFDISLRLFKGEAVSLVGPNGAGKSTLIKTIAGHVLPKKGSISFKGRNLAGLPTYKIARLGIGYVPEERRIFADLSVAENMEAGKKSADARSNPWTEERIFALFPALAKMQKRSGGALSGGEQQMLALARTLLGNPSLLLLDEPAEGLAPIMAKAMAEAIREVKAAGVSILLSEQSSAFSDALIDRSFAMERGRLVPMAVKKN